MTAGEISARIRWVAAGRLQREVDDRLQRKADGIIWRDVRIEREADDRLRLKAFERATQ